jgi:hypothetical protein
MGRCAEALRNLRLTEVEDTWPNSRLTSLDTARPSESLHSSLFVYKDLGVVSLGAIDL